METIKRVVTTENKKIEEFEGWQDPRLDEEYDMPKSKNIAVLVEVQVPESLAEAAESQFYGSEAAVLDVLKDDTARIRTNAARPLLREADRSDFDFAGVAQQAVDSYQAGRRGGFVPRVSEQEMEDIDDIDELKAFLKRRGAVSSAA